MEGMDGPNEDLPKSWWARCAVRDGLGHFYVHGPPGHTKSTNWPHPPSKLPPVRVHHFLPRLSRPIFPQSNRPTKVTTEVCIRLDTTDSGTKFSRMMHRIVAEESNPGLRGGEKT
jgi:hypothetical protein